LRRATRIGSREAAANRDNGIALAEQHGSAALLDQLMPKMLSPSALPSLKAQVRSIAEAQPQQSLMAALAAMRDRSDATETLRALDVPCLLVGASEDALAPPDVMRDMKRTQPDADLVMLAGVGHLSAMQAPAEFTGALGHFFDSLRH
jgi:pimeloyl-ACP methyl ester carboxylesterase